ncbi:hypothetical protein Clacol_003304 [Clathrus columnatus]|uniref:NmrA-like domain-containing protein n=1 Tax=Clathrus columnatus TaxID=1419009 RepID=A0AAV5A5Z6_9AGAM|nr:hypothetical protein Clacol_003304 [Clathrus columnatus]
MVRTVLVTGSTGLQARALIKSLLSSNSSSEDKFRILGLTRNPSNPLAQSLQKECQDDPNIDETGLTFVKGNLDDEAGLCSIFEEEKKKDGIWGVHIVLPFPGLGNKVDGEAKQGILVANLALEYSVSHVIYSSAARLTSVDEQGTASHGAKGVIEKHVKSLGEKGLKYTIIQPSLFMELFEGPLGPLTVSMFRAGLPPDTKIQLIASEDIGNIAGAIFKNHEQYIGKTILVVGDVLTVKEQDEAYKNATGRARSASPSILAKIILKTSSAAKEIVVDIRKEHEARTADAEGFEKGLKESKAVYPEVMTYETWVKKVKERAPPKGWNKLSLVNVLTGKKA